MTTDIKNYMSLRPHITLLAIFSDWLVISLVIYISILSNNVLIYLFSIVVIGSRQHSLSVLSHDFVHYSVLKNKRFSEYVGNIFTSWPLFYRISGFRSQHLEHHRHLNTLKDPDLLRRYSQDDWSFPKKKSQIYFLLLRDLLGINFYQNFKKLYILHNKNGKHKKNFVNEKKDLIMLQTFFYGLVVLFLLYTNSFYHFFIFWLIPFFTYHKFIKRIRAISEHFAIPNNGYEQQTRTILLNPIESFLICPRNVNFHLEHHLYPTVPWYNLKSLSNNQIDVIKIRKSGHYTIGIFSGLINDINFVSTKDCISQTDLY